MKEEDRDKVKDKLRKKKVLVGENGYNIKKLKNEYAKEKLKDSAYNELNKIYTKKISYKKSNPIKSLILKKKRGAVYVNSKGESINLMKFQW